MTCDPWQAKLDAYVDGDSAQEDSAGLDAHLRTCPSCAADALARLKMKRMTQAAAARYSPSPQFRLSIEKVDSEESKTAVGIYLDADAGCMRGGAGADHCLGGFVDETFRSRADSGGVA